jgi:hypothetical protein
MKYEEFRDKARVWKIARGVDGGLEAELDERLLATLDPMAEAIIRAAARNDVAANRAW